MRRLSRRWHPLMGQIDDRNPRQKRIDFWPIVEPNYGLMSDFPDSDSTRQASALTKSRWNMGYCQP